MENEQIALASLQAENARMRSIFAMLTSLDVINDALYQLKDAGDFEGYAELFEFKAEVLDKAESSEAPKPKSEVTLTEDEIEWPEHVENVINPHDADDFTKQDLEFFARQDNPNSFWYYQELSTRQKELIAQRRKELNLD